MLINLEGHGIPSHYPKCPLCISCCLLGNPTPPTPGPLTPPAHPLLRLMSLRGLVTTTPSHGLPSGFLGAVSSEVWTSAEGRGPQIASHRVVSPPAGPLCSVSSSSPTASDVPLSPRLCLFGKVVEPRGLQPFRTGPGTESWDSGSLRTCLVLCIYPRDPRPLPFLCRCPACGLAGSQCGASAEGNLLVFPVKGRVC